MCIYIYTLQHEALSEPNGTHAHKLLDEIVRDSCQGSHSLIAIIKIESSHLL